MKLTNEERAEINRAFDEQDTSDPRVAMTWLATVAYVSHVHDPAENELANIQEIIDVGRAAALDGESAGVIGIAAIAVFMEEGSRLHTMHAERGYFDAA